MAHMVHDSAPVTKVNFGIVKEGKMYLVTLHEEDEKYSLCSKYSI
jgi:hypothetical protein